MTYQPQGSIELHYTALKAIHKSSTCEIELVKSTENQKLYIKRTYPEDKREIFEILQKHSSPYIPFIKDIFFNTDTIIIEEYIEAETLDNKLSSSSISSKQASKYLFQLLKAVDAIHKLGIIHRDIKPDNILIDNNNNLKLIDYGISRIYRVQETSDTQLLGTPGYAAPEQFGYTQSDFRTDIYAVGMTCKALNKSCRPSRLLKKIEQKSTRFDPAQRYQNIQSIFNEYRKQKLLKVFALLLLVILSSSSIAALNKSKMGILSFVENDIVYGSNDERLFKTTEPEPCMLLTENTQREAKITVGEGIEPISVRAALSQSGLSLEITDSANKTNNYLLNNEYPYPLDYINTMLYSEILFYDLDSDGTKEILAAISDREVLQLNNAGTYINQNYMACWCLYYKEGIGFIPADKQLITCGLFEVDGNVIPNGFWLNNEFEGYRYENGSLTEVDW